MTHKKITSSKKTSFKYKGLILNFYGSNFHESYYLQVYSLIPYNDFQKYAFTNNPGKYY